MAWNPDGSQLASGSLDGTLRIWDASSESVLATLKGHSAGINAMAFADDGRVCTTSDDGTLKLWRTSRGGGASRSGPTATIRLGGKKNSTPINCAFAPDGTLIVGDRDDVLSFVDPRKTDAAVFSASFPRQEMNELVFAFGALWCACGMNKRGYLARIDVDALRNSARESVVVEGELEQAVVRYSLAGTSTSFALDERAGLMCVGSADALVTGWRLDREGRIRCVTSFGRVHHPLRSVSVSSGGLGVAYAGEDGSVLVSSVADETKVLGRYDLKGPANAVVAHPTKETVLAFCGDEKNCDDGPVIRLVDYASSSS